MGDVCSKGLITLFSSGKVYDASDMKFAPPPRGGGGGDDFIPSLPGRVCPKVMDKVLFWLQVSEMSELEIKSILLHIETCTPYFERLSNCQISIVDVEQHGCFIQQCLIH